MTSIADRWNVFYGELEDLCDELSRSVPKVVAVTKTRSMDEVQQVIDLGIESFGENYAGELKSKQERFPDKKWHFIGSLQSNKVDIIANHSQEMETLQRKKIVRRLAKYEYNSPCFVQVNISGEDSKSGLQYQKQKVADFIEFARNEGLNVIGLMTIGNFSWDNVRNQVEFEKFIQFGRSLGLENFSLGMSGDWREAVKAGSTQLRIGTAIFGPRQN